MSALPDRKHQVRQIFDRAMELAPAQQPAFLVQACGQDESLRRELDALLCLHAEARQAIVEPAACGEQPGDRIGHYKLRQKIGAGGFGTVWMAEQEVPVRRKVALKVLKPGMDTAQVMGRFEAERQALALMDHPNIAKVFDGGATATGRPYFVMELVKGVSITKYCDEAGSSMAERLNLFVAVCHAVQHAHQKGVIHRDLKPSNVLVTLHDGEPVPKVIDFGIAKATQGRLADRTVFTEFRQMLGTPEYMAPEQAELSGLDVDTRADIYSLGVLLYELLTGTRPFEMQSLLDAGFDAVLRTIREVDPPKPSTRVSTLGEQIVAIARHRKVHPKSFGALMRGDLDWIVMKALEKERSRRYGTATALAEDVVRHLRDEPVLAGPPSRVYRIRKYVRRHRVGVAAATAIFLSLATGIVGIGLAYRDAKAQEKRAERFAEVAAGERQAAVAAQDAERGQRLAAEAAEARVRQEAAKAQAVVRLLTSTLASSNPHENKGRNYPVRLVLADFERSLREQPALDPEVEATLRAVLGESYLGLGLVDAAAPHVRRALELRRDVHGERHVEVAGAHLREAYLLHERQQFAEALAAVETGERALAGDGSAAETEQRIELLDYRTDLLRHLDRLPEAETVGRACLALARQHHGDEHAAVAKALQCLARVLHGRGDPGAVSVQRDALAMQRKVSGEAHPAVAISLNNLGLQLSDRGDLAGAKATHQEALTVARGTLGDDHPETWLLWSNSVGAVFRSGAHAEAESLQRELVRRKRRGLEPDDPGLAASLHDLGSILHERGDPAGAEPVLREALTIRKKLWGDEHTLVAASKHQLGFALQELGNLDGAEVLYRETIDLRRKLLGNRDSELAKTLANLGMLRHERGDLTGAEELVREAVAILRGSSDRQTSGARLAAHFNLGVVLAARGDAAGAAGAYREGLDAARVVHGPEHLLVASFAHGLARVLRTTGDLAGAEDLHREALALRKKLLPADRVEIAVSLSDLGVVRADRGDLEEAEGLHRAALPLWLKGRGAEHSDVATCLNNIGDVLRRRGDLDGAERFLRDALAMRRKLFGTEHEQVARSLEDLGLVLAKRRDVAGAGQCYIESKAMLRKLLGDGHAEVADPAVAKVLAAFARAAAQRGDHAEAARGYREALAIRLGLFGVEHVDVADTQVALARCLVQLGDHAGAEPLARAALTFRAAQVPDTWPHHSAMALLGRALAGQARFADAEPLLVAACKGQPPAAAVYLLRDALACLIEGYERAGRAAEAAPWKAKLQGLQGGEPTTGR